MRSGPTEVDRIHEDIVDILQCYSRTCNQTHRELKYHCVTKERDFLIKHFPSVRFKKLLENFMFNSTNLLLDMVLCMRILVVEKVSLWSGELEYH